MIQNINDLSIILSIVNDFEKNGGIRKKELFLLLQDKFPYIQWDIRPKELLSTAMQLNLITARNARIIPTKFGRIVQNMSTDGVDLNYKQVSYVAENCVLTNKNFAHLIGFLKLFVFDKRHKTMIYNTADYPISDISDMELLSQLGITYRRKAMLLLNSDYLDLVDEIIHLQTQDRSRTKTFTQEQLERILVEQAKIGRLAEDLSMQYEKSRLRSKSLNEEASKIRQVSITNANIGYDIESFKQRTPSMRPDLFIEVKARKHNLNSFIISDNEIRVAKRLGTKYAIYFWNGLGYATPSSPTRIIRDPVNTLKIQECDNCLSYIVYLDKYEQLP